MKRVLVLSPHPDDESIGCGGTICQHVAVGDEVRVIFLTSGEKGGHGASLEMVRKTREAEARAAARILGVEQIEFWRAPDGGLSATRKLLIRLTGLLKEWRPDIVYTTHPGEAHPDHRAAPRILQRGLGLAQIRSPVIYLFEIWTPIGKLDHIVDISRWMNTKLRAVRRYRSQCAVVQFDAAVAGLNRYRGEMHSWPEGEFAEVFKRMNP